MEGVALTASNIFHDDFQRCLKEATRSVEYIIMESCYCHVMCFVASPGPLRNAQLGAIEGMP